MVHSHRKRSALTARVSDCVCVCVCDATHGRYMGTWYEIANIPFGYQPGDSTDTTATYALKDDGKTVTVQNRTFLKGPDEQTRGGPAGIDGIAFKNDEKDEDAKFTVRFMVPPFFPIIPVRGDYWVIALCDDYTWAVVGQPGRKRGWILSRTPQMEVRIASCLHQPETCDFSPFFRDVGSL